MSGDPNIKKSFWTGALSNYARVFLRMALGLVTFRLLYQGLTREEFGFWALLWSVFGYGILLDFGFGYAAQKRVAELSVRRDWPTLSQVLSTIFLFYLAASAILVSLAFLFSGTLIQWFHVSPENRESFRIALIVFIAGIGLGFPMGIFPEVLRGQQRIAAANQIAMGGMLANFLSVVLVLHFHWPFLTLIVLALLCVLVPDTVAMVVALRRMPEVKIRPRHFSFRQMIETSRFSLYAYLNMLSNMLRNKTDQVVISSVLAVERVAPYQAGAKVGEMFNLMTRQISDALSPAAAYLHAKGDRRMLSEMLVNGMRWNVLAATPLYIACAFYLKGLLRLLTGEASPSGEMLWVGQLLLFWYWSLAVTHMVYKRMFFMAGQERRMMLQGVAEALINLALSVVLTWKLRSIVGVAWGSVVPTFLFGWLLLWPWAAKEAGLSPRRLFMRAVARPVFGCLPMLAAAVGLKLQPWWESGANTLLLFLEGGFILAVGGAGIWFLSFNAEDRARWLGRLERFTAKLNRKGAR